MIVTAIAAALLAQSPAPAAAQPAPPPAAAPAKGAVAVPPVPTAAEYLAMTPEQRYALRLQVRALPAEQRVPWLKKLEVVVHSLPEADANRLHDERNAMDAKYGTKPVQ